MWLQWGGQAAGRRREGQRDNGGLAGQHRALDFTLSEKVAFGDFQ